MQCFQGCYCDRTDGGMECRYFAAVYPSVQLAAFILYGSVQNEVALSSLAIMLIGLAIITFVVQPYKDTFKLHNKVDGTMSLLLAVHFLGIINKNDTMSKYPLARCPYIGLALSAAVSLFPLVCIFLVIFCQIFPHQHQVRAFKLLQKLTYLTSTQSQAPTSQ